MTTLQAFGLTEQAGRDSNDDAFLAAADLPMYAVADGIGARAGAGTASRRAVESLVRHLAPLMHADGVEESQLRRVVAAINADVIAAGVDDPSLSGLGTTLSAVVISHRTAHIVHIGDSRIYHIGHSRIEQLTREHTVANDLVTMKRLDASDVARHPLRSMLSRFIGSPNDAIPDISKVDLQPADCLLLATDGLTAVLSDDDITQCWRQQSGGGVQPFCQALIAAALSRRPTDNVTVVAVQMPAATGAAHD